LIRNCAASGGDYLRQTSRCSGEQSWRQSTDDPLIASAVVSRADLALKKNKLGMQYRAFGTLCTAYAAPPAISAHIHSLQARSRTGKRALTIAIASPGAPSFNAVSGNHLMPPYPYQKDSVGITNCTAINRPRESARTGPGYHDFVVRDMESGLRTKSGPKAVLEDDYAFTKDKNKGKAGDACDDARNRRCLR
jgi:hypothetical protein